MVSAFLGISLVSPTHCQISDEKKMPQISVSDLPPAEYPPMARAARVSGDVRLRMSLHPDGSIASVEFIDGPPMLRQSALALAERTRFDCTACRKPLTSFTVTFQFEFTTATCADDPREPNSVSISSSGELIRITAKPYMLCDPAATITRVRARSLKCLYLWPCGWRNQPAS